MPFDEEDPKEFVPKHGLKQVSGQKSIFDDKLRKPTQQEFQQKVQDAQEKISGYKRTASTLFLKFQEAMNDKTLPQNRTVLKVEVEQEILQDMIQLAIDINNDPNEKEGMGSLTWITLLFKTCLAQRDRLNSMEYAIVVLQKKTDPAFLSDVINKEISKALDSKKVSE